MTGKINSGGANASPTAGLKKTRGKNGKVKKFAIKKPKQGKFVSDF